MKREDVKLGLLCTHQYGGLDIFQVVGIDSVVVVNNLTTGRIGVQVSEGNLLPLKLQPCLPKPPESILRGDSITPSRYDYLRAPPGSFDLQAHLDKVQPLIKPTEPAVILRAKDPSKGQATHYATIQLGYPYHRVTSDAVYYWVDRDGGLGYWYEYTHYDDGMRNLRGSVALRVLPVYAPTKKDYAKAKEITRVKHTTRTLKIRHAINALEKAQMELNQRYSRKLDRVDALLKAARL